MGNSREFWANVVTWLTLSQDCFGCCLENRLRESKDTASSLSWSLSSPCVDVRGNCSSLSIPTWTWSHPTEKTEPGEQWGNEKMQQNQRELGSPPCTELPVSWINKYPYGSNQSKSSSLFLALKNLSIWFIIQSHYPSSSPCMLWLPVFTWLCVRSEFRKWCHFFSLWNVLPWNPLNLESTNYQTHHLLLTMCVF